MQGWLRTLSLTALLAGAVVANEVQIVRHNHHRLEPKQC